MDQWVYFALHYGDNERGFLQYNKETKEFEVHLPEEQWVQRVKEYLTKIHTIKHATGLNTYDELTIEPLSSLDNLKLALTRMWENNKVQVDWGIPVEINGEFRFPE